MTGLDQVAKEIFQILKTYGYTVQLFDEEGASVQSPEDARRMFDQKKNILVSIIEDNENSIVNLVIGDDIDISSINGFIQTLRTCVNEKFTLNFNIQRHEGEITPKSDGMVENINRIKRHVNMDLFESLYGTSKSSYLKLENARLIIKHSKPVDETKHGSRTRCIESIFVENDKGERMLFPTRNILPARAMAQHVSMGGGFHDQIAGQITRMANDFSNLASASQHVFNNSVVLPESAGMVREACKKKMAGLRKTFEKMSKPNGYTMEAAKMIENANRLVEGEDEDIISSEKIEEVRSMIALEGVNLEDSLIESVCRAMQDEEDLTEVQGSKDVGLKNFVTVLGKKVNTQAWTDLCQGKVQLHHRVSSEDHGDMIDKLVILVSAIQDDSLSNLASYIADTLKMPPEEISSDTVTKMKRIARAIVAAAGMMNDVPSKVGAVKEYFEWFDSLNTKNVLNERNHPDDYDHMKNPYETADDEQDVDDVIASIKHNFDIADFCEEYMKENGLDDESLHPEERVSDEKALIDAIDSKLHSMFEEESDLTPPDDMTYVAKKILPKIKEHLEEHGIVINEDSLDEDDHDPWNDEPEHNIDIMDTIRALGGDEEFETPSDIDQFGLDESLEEFLKPREDKLRRSDIIELPSKNQGDSLKREVTKANVTYPDGKEGKPSDGYISDLRTLAGMDRPGTY